MKSDRIVARRLVGLLVGVSVAGIPLTLLTFLEPLVLPISPLLMTLLMLVLLIGLPLPLLSALPELAYPRDELSVRNAIRKGQIGAVVLLIAALVAWLVLPHITQGGAGLARKGSILLGAAVLRAPAHDGHDSGTMADSIPVAWRTVLRRHAGQFGPLSGMVSGMPGTLSA